MWEICWIIFIIVNYTDIAENQVVLIYPFSLWSIYCHCVVMEITLASLYDHRLVRVEYFFVVLHRLLFTFGFRWFYPGGYCCHSCRLELVSLIYLDFIFVLFWDFTIIPIVWMHHCRDSIRRYCRFVFVRLVLIIPSSSFALWDESRLNWAASRLSACRSWIQPWPTIDGEGRTLNVVSLGFW